MPVQAAPRPGSKLGFWLTVGMRFRRTRSCAESWHELESSREREMEPPPMSVDRGAPGGPTSLKATAGMRRRGTSAAQLANRLIADLAGGGLAQIPVAIRFWDG